MPLQQFLLVIRQISSEHSVPTYRALEATNFSP